MSTVTVLTEHVEWAMPHRAHWHAAHAITVLQSDVPYKTFACLALSLSRFCGCLLPTSSDLLSGLAPLPDIPEVVTAVAADADLVLARLKGIRGDSRFVKALAALEGGRWYKGPGCDVGPTVQQTRCHLVALSDTDWLPAADLQCIEELLFCSPIEVSHWSAASVPGCCLISSIYRQLAAVLLIYISTPDTHQS